MKISDVKSEIIDYSYNYDSWDPSAVDTIPLAGYNRQRYPMEYTPREYVSVGPLKLLQSRNYQATVRDTSYGLIRTDTVTPAVGNYPERKQISLLALEKFVSVPMWVENLLEQDRIAANVAYLNETNNRKVSMLEELRNGRESLNTIASSVLRMSRILARAKRAPKEFLKHNSAGRKRLVHGQIKTVGDLWLEGRYHWLPTYLTMRDAFIGLQDQYPFGQVRHKSEWRRYTWTETIDTYAGKLSYDVELASQYQLGCWYTPTEEYINLMHRYGVGSITDLAAVAWELTPWSLVVDWVLPVSDLLLAASALDGVTTHCDWQTHKTIAKTSNTRLDVEPATASQSHSLVFNYLQPETFVESYIRTTQPSRELDLRLFLNTMPLNWRRALDALSFFSGSEMSKKIISGKT